MSEAIAFLVGLLVGVIGWEICRPRDGTDDPVPTAPADGVVGAKPRPTLAGQLPDTDDLVSAPGVDITAFDGRHL